MCLLSHYNGKYKANTISNRHQQEKSYHVPYHLSKRAKEDSFPNEENIKHWLSHENLVLQEWTGKVLLLRIRPWHKTNKNGVDNSFTLKPRLVTCDFLLTQVHFFQNLLYRQHIACMGSVLGDGEQEFVRGDWRGSPQSFLLFSPLVLPSSPTPTTSKPWKSHM